MLGDALWAAMIVWWVSAAAPSAPRSWRAAIALAFCFCVELSQMYRAPWLDAARRTSVGHLVLGSDFDPRDFAAYAAGVVAAVLVDKLLHRKRTFPTQA